MAKKCKKSDIHCGTILSSHCVDYTGAELKSLGKEVDQCDISVSEAIEDIDSELKKVKDGLDTKKLVRLCIDSIDREDTPIIVINKLISEICDLNKKITDLEDKLDSLDILSLPIDINDSCLDSSHCASDSSMRSVLNKIITDLCLLKTQFNNGSSNSSTVFRP